MKNNYAFGALILCLLAIMPGCKKGIETCRLGKFYNSDGNNTPNPNTFSYYEDGRLKTIEYSNLGKDSVFYSADTINIWTYDDRDSLTAKFTGFVNTSGYVVGGRRTIYDDQGNAGAETTYVCDYTPDGNLAYQIISTTGSTTTYRFIYTDGNRTSGSVITNTDTSRYTFYHNTAENKSGVDEVFDPFYPYFGKPSKNLPDSMHIIDKPDTIRIRFAHQLDRNDYVVKTTKSYLNTNQDSRIFAYSYFDCKE